ncbi:MAG: LysM peptidoglycan-binding domain-containing protein [Flavobacteriales bacterium]|nr:LysM peptidoglycan-binding domain-containing protein [Flavobacteriales bacterium]
MLCLVTLVMTGSSAFAQPSGAKKEVIDGKEYYIHTVVKGETIYGISKTYKTTQDAILKANPGSEKGLSIGQQLRIPVASEKTVKDGGKDNSKDQSEIDKKFNQYMADGDKAMSAKDYAKALQFYKSAKDLKPESPTAFAAYKKADEALAAQQKEQKNGAPVATKEYKVEKGETIYGISRKLKISQEKILELNPDAIHGLQEGQILKIPAEGEGNNEKVIKDNPAKEIVSGDIVLLEHAVQKGESLYGLSQKYHVSQDSIKLYNNGLPEGIKSGQVLIIPVSKIAAEKNGWKAYPDIRKNEETKVEMPRGNGVKEVYKVGLFLPFYLDKNQSMMENKGPLSNVELFEPTRQSLDFYHGVLLALDSLSKYGLNVDLKVYDTARDSVKLAKYVAEADFANLDLIIGPTDLVEIVARAAKEKKIPMVCPFGYTNKILFENPYVTKAVSTTSIMVSEMSEYIATTYANENIILIDGKGKKDETIVAAYKKELNEKLISGGRKDSIRIVKTDVSGNKAWVERLSKDKINVLVVPSSDLSFVSSFFNTLQGTSLKTQYKEYRFAVIGTEDWIKWDDIEAHLKVKFGVHIPSSVSISFNDTLRTVPFIQAFRSKFSTDPDKYAMMGFDLAYFYLGGYLKEGTSFASHLEDFDVELVHTRFKFRRVSNGSGYINSNVYILKYEDFRLIPVKK